MFSGSCGPLQGHARPGEPTQSPAARRPPTRCRVPSTRRTRLRPGRSPRSRSRIPPGAAATEAVWSSAPGAELGLTLGGHGKPECDQGSVDSFPTVRDSSSFPHLHPPSIPPGNLGHPGALPGDGAPLKDQSLHVGCSSVLLSVEHIVSFTFFGSGLNPLSFNLTVPFHR